MAALGDADIRNLGTAPVAVEPYVSPDYFELERKNLFAKVWLMAGREMDMPEVGDYLVKEIRPCHASVLITRAEDRRLRAFHNVCSHRGTKVVGKSRGHAARFACPYHGWGYNLMGELRSVPDETKFYGLDKAKCGLPPVAVDSASGFIFINLDPTPAQSLQEYLGGVAARLAEHPFNEWTSCYALEAHVPVYWKLIIDAFQETYHLSFAHAITVVGRSTGPGNPLGHPIGFELYGPHRTMGIWGNPEHRPSPVELFAIQHGGVISQGAADAAHRRIPRHPNWQMEVHGIFPNYFVDVAPSFFITHEVQPIAVNRTIWTSYAWFPPAKTASERISQEFSVAAYRDTAVEDLAILTAQQQGLESGAKSVMLFQQNEVLCRYFNETVDRFARPRHGTSAAARARGEASWS